MKKILTLTHLLDLFTLFAGGLLLLDSVFYYGFSQKHFYLNSKSFFVFYIFFALVLFLIKKITISPILNKYNILLFPLILICAIGFNFLEDSTYVNFVYTKFHLNPTNFLGLPLLSGFIFYLNNPRFFKKHFYFLVPYFSLFFSQLISFSLSFRYDIVPNYIAYFINYFLWLSVLIFCTSLFKKKSHSTILYLTFFSLFTLINHFKIKYLYLFFIISDLLLVKHISQYLSKMFLQLEMLDSIVIVSFIFLLVYLLIFIKKKLILLNPPLKYRLFLFIISGFIIIYPFLFSNHYKTLLKNLKIETHVWGPIENCTNNGIIFCFYDDLKNLKNVPPANYNQSTIQQIFSNIHLTSKEIPTTNLTKPTIIIILSEAFWDITKFPNTKFSPDPIPNIRKDIKSTLVSPTIGTATANVEFELLSGFSNYFLNGTVPYSQAVRKDMPSLFTIFKDSGYQTTTIHPFYGSMYNRPQVYKNFGLEKYISVEKMIDYEMSGAYVSDKSLTQEILKQYRSTTQPQLIFALSMQNHFPFETDRFSKHNIKITSSLSTDNQNILQTYTDGINLSDEAYLTLKNEITKNNQPTIIIFFGDHLPLLNPGLELYQDAKYDTKDILKMHSTPIAIWSNFNPKINFEKLQLSPNFLGLEILRIANLTPKNQFLYLQSISSTDTTLHPNIPPKFNQEQLKNYEMIQYDIIFGKQYSLK